MRRVLILTCAGGGAHLSAASAVEERLRDDPGVEAVHRVDVLSEWAGPVGRLGVRIWNAAMRRGDARTMNAAVGLLRVGDAVFYLPVLLRARAAFRRLGITDVYDCQVVGTRALMSAARGRITVTKVLTEPAHASVPQYYGPIKRLPQRLRRDLRLWAGPPLLAAGETVERFWRGNCGLDPSQIDDDRGFPVRACFRNGVVADRSSVMRFGETRVAVPSSANVVTILMGSQGTRRFTLDAVTRLLETDDDPSLFVFAYVPDWAQREEIRALVERSGSGVRVFCFPYLEASAVAKLYRRSDVTITRSGGMTCMELLSVGRGRALVYSAGHRSNSRCGMIEHEYGNFRYLERFHRGGAQVVDADDLAERLAAVLRRDVAMTARVAP